MIILKTINNTRYAHGDISLKASPCPPGAGYQDHPSSFIHKWLPNTEY